MGIIISQYKDPYKRMMQDDFGRISKSHDPWFQVGFGRYTLNADKYSDRNPFDG